MIGSFVAHSKPAAACALGCPHGPLLGRELSDHPPLAGLARAVKSEVSQGGAPNISV